MSKYVLLFVLFMSPMLAIPNRAEAQFGGASFAFEREVLEVDPKSGPIIQAYDPNCAKGCARCGTAAKIFNDLSPIKSAGQMQPRLSQESDLQRVVWCSTHAPFAAWSALQREFPGFPIGSRLLFKSGFTAGGQKVDDLIYSVNDGIKWERAVATESGFRIVKDTGSQELGIHDMRIAVKFPGKRTYYRLLFIPLGGGRRDKTSEVGVQYLLFDRPADMSLGNAWRGYCAQVKAIGGFPLDIVPTLNDVPVAVNQNTPPPAKTEPLKDPPVKQEPLPTPAPAKAAPKAVVVEPFDLLYKRTDDRVEFRYNQPERVELVQYRVTTKGKTVGKEVIRLDLDADSAKPIRALWKPGYTVEFVVLLDDQTTEAFHVHFDPSEKCAGCTEVKK